jgi:8-oxo-dGTP pyrophosphatase MutT (NUDIX family)
MQKYSLVVPLSEDFKRVALVEKLGRGPSFVAGRANYPGGKHEPGESAEHAAVREFREETGLKVEVSDLERIAFYSKKDDYELTVFAVRIPSAQFEEAHTTTDEVVVKLDVEHLRETALADPHRYVPDILTLLDLAFVALNRDAHVFA